MYFAGTYYVRVPMFQWFQTCHQLFKILWPSTRESQYIPVFWTEFGLALAARLTPNKVVSHTLMTGEGGCSYLEALRFLLSLEDFAGQVRIDRLKAFLTLWVVYGLAGGLICERWILTTNGTLTSYDIALCNLGCMTCWVWSSRQPDMATAR